MNARFPFSAWVGCLALLLLAGCKADVNLNNIDTKTQLDLGIAIPIGSMSATIGDFLNMGTEIEGLYVDSLENKGILTFKDTFSVERKFHQVDLSQYISETTLSMNVYDKLDGLPIMYDHQIMGNDNYPITLDFPLALHLSGINNDEDYERLDSALIANAKFVSTVNATNLPLKWEWINSITLDLGTEFSREGGNSVVVYRKGDGYGYGEEIPIDIAQFSLNLMKNSHPSSWEGYVKNVIDTCGFVIHFNFTVPTSAGVITVPETAAFDYKLAVQFIDYTAIWGMFKPSAQMSDHDTVYIADSWDMWHYLKRARLPFAEPVLDIDITTQVAGALQLQGDFLFVATEDYAEQRFASFDGQQTYYRTFHKGEYLPVSSEIGDSATMRVKFDKDAARGNIDQLFMIRPDIVGYKFQMDFNRQEEPQLRITPNTGVRLDAIVTLPLIFNEGTAISYADTLQEVDLSALTLDSLLASIDAITVDSVRTSDLKLLVQFKNTIPLQIKAVLRALDENNQLIMDPDDPTQPLRLTAQDTIRIAAPKVEYTGGQFITTASETVQVLSVSKAHFDVFDRIKSIQYEASIDDESLQSAFDAGNYKVRIAEDNKLTIQIGVAAYLDATFDFNTDSNK